jgi:pSer/pThr/pTyr-binding forkhead associated (FHA) protein
MIVVGPPRIPNRLVVSSGPLAGSELPLLNQPITIGRGANNTLVLEDDYASSKHACIYPTDDGWVVEDLNSTNGTFLDGAPLVGSAPMPLGARVTIGNSILELVS